VKEKIYLALCLALAFVGARSASACSCDNAPPSELYALSDAVFFGTPLSYAIIKDSYGVDTYLYMFDVTACWKGDVEEIIELRAVVSEASCGVFLPLGDPQLVYAFENQGNLTTNMCLVAPFGGGGYDHLGWLGEPACTTISIDESSWGSVKALYR